MGPEGMDFQAWVHNRCQLVLRIGGADFLHCWVANSIWLERAELLLMEEGSL